MAWCCQAASHNHSHCWPRSLSPYGITRPQWVHIFCLNQITSKDLFTSCWWMMSYLTHWGWKMNICISKSTNIGWDNGFLPRRHPAIIWTNAGIFLIEPLGTKFSEILFEFHTFFLKKMHLKMSSTKWGPFCLGLDVNSYSCVDTWNINLIITLSN